MDLITILNRIEKHKGFVYETGRFGGDADVGASDRIEIVVRPRKNSRAVCSKCDAPGPTYDHLPPRTFGFVPLWAFPVVFLYAMRRVNCPDCGVKVETVPWAAGKSPVTRSLALFLADWAKLLSWEATARRFGVNWHQVRTAVAWVVEWGIEHRDLSDVTAIGVDEIYHGGRKRCFTVVYQLCGNVRRLLYVGPKRDAAALEAFFDEMGDSWCANITHVCTDMWKAFRKPIENRLVNAMHILDRFHIVKLLNEAVDQVRRTENAALRKMGLELLTGLKYLFLKRPENLTERQGEKLMDVLCTPWLKTARAYLWKQKFQIFWEYTSPYWAKRYLDRWCKGAMRSRLEPIKKFVRTIRAHEDLILNWFIAKKQFSSGAVEGMNRKLKLVTRTAYGYRTPETMKIALFHALGALPEPERTHRF